MIKIFFKYITLLSVLTLVIVSPVYSVNTATVVDIAGFEYDYENKLYTTKINALQRFFGFNRGYDYMGIVFNMVIDIEPIVFNYNNNFYMIELWKGQYYGSTGSEIGFYKKSLINGHWDTVSDQEMLVMAFTLNRDSKEIFSLSKLHWWVTGFKPGLFSEPYQLSLEDIQINFKEEAMGRAFYYALLDYFSLNLALTEYNVQFVEPNIVKFRWHKPIALQYHLKKRKYYQYSNHILANALYKNMHPDYSPEAFDQKMDDIKNDLIFSPVDQGYITGFEKILN